MMTHQGQYNNFYNPVGSSRNQHRGHNIQHGGNSATVYNDSRPFPSLESNQQGYGSAVYGTQSHGNGLQPITQRSLFQGPLNAQADGSHASSNRSNLGPLYSQPNWHGPVMNLPGRLTPNTSSTRSGPTEPLLPPIAQSSNKFHMRDMNEPSQNRVISPPYQNSYPTQNSLDNPRAAEFRQLPPQLYNGSQLTGQAQYEDRQRQESHGSGYHPSPQVPGSNHESAGSGSQAQLQFPNISPATVNPSQVYDNRAELQNIAQMELEKWRKREAERAAEMAREERAVSEQKKRTELETLRLGQRQKFEQEMADRRNQAQHAESNDQRRQAREETNQSKTAAAALQSLALGNLAPAAETDPTRLDQEETEMRAMFKKMREFNSKNPEMLAKLWEEERRSHAQAQAHRQGKSQSQSRSPSAPPAKSNQNIGHTTTTSVQQGNGSFGASTTSASDVSALAPSQNPPPNTATKLTKTVSTPLSPVKPDQQLQPASAHSANSLWPPHKKDSLAEFTAKWLLSQPINATKHVGKDIVLKILDSNPSYVQLCEALERRGLKFERSLLARELLRAVPSGHKPPPGSKPNANSEPNHNNVPKSHSALSNTQLTDVPVVGQVNSNISQIPEPNGVHGVNNEMSLPSQASMSAPYLVHQVSSAKNIPSGRLSYQPTKEVSGRPSQAAPTHTTDTSAAGTAADIVLTKQEEPPRAPADKEEAARKRTFGDLVDLTADDSGDEEPPTKKAAFDLSSVKNGSIEPMLQPMKNKMHAPPVFSGVGTNAAFPTTQTDAGSGPAQGTMPVMSDHRYHYPSTATARQPMPAQRGPSLEQLQQLRMRGKMLVEPIMRDRVARKSKYDRRTIARDILLATGRHPDMRGLNAHFAPMQKLLVDHGGQVDFDGRNNLRCDLATIKWEVVDPDRAEDPSTRNQLSNSTSLGEKPASELVKPVVKRDNALQSVEKPPPGTHTFSVKAKRGRPSKAFLGEVARIENDGTVPRGLTNKLGESTSSSPRPPNITPDATMTSPVGYSAFQQYDADGKKKKGRPVGWRKAIHSREAQGLLTKAKPSTKDSDVSHGITHDKQVEPKYQEYNCAWEGCKASLHNLETLKKHVVKLHAHPTDHGHFPCLWRHCDGRKYAGLDHWLNHVIKKHIQPVAWALGDGPKGHPSNNPPHDAGTYLSDSRGRSVTPVISPSPSAEANDYLSNSSWPKTISKPPKDGDARSIFESLRELERHKQAVGPILDRQGCVLVSAERRDTFLEDEDFEDQVEGSEHDQDPFGQTT